MYKKQNKWTGRIDGSSHEYLRWHQKIKCVDIEDVSSINIPFFGILGFCCDEGVRRNKGRVGAKHGPQAIRQMCANLPALSANIYDFGNVICENYLLEAAQSELAENITKIHKFKGKTIVFGGGHEVMYAHYSGLRKAYNQGKIGIINIDAHFDNREIDTTVGASSGTGFWQIAQEKADYHYLAIGIQENANTKVLFDFAKNQNNECILGVNFSPNNGCEQIIENFIDSVDILYLTVCLDVFAAAFAPGVSASAFSGIFPDKYFKEIFKSIAKSPKLVAFDIAELNPNLDIDNRTARLAASLVFDFLKSMSKS